MIVPNSELITRDVINWTRTGTRRRIEVSVGVAYGNDLGQGRPVSSPTWPRRTPRCSATPGRLRSFTGFGENSLDFLVRAWTDSIDWMVVRSDISVALHGALRDSAMEFPFPQRDLHLRSVDASVLAGLRDGTRPAAGTPAP